MINLSIVEYVKQDSIQSNIQEVLKERTPQFISSVVSLVNTNTKFANVDRKSILNACLIAASLDLPINQNLGYAYVIPYADKAQFQMGYKGFIQLAMRSRQFQKINVTDVKEGEILSIDRLSGEISFNWVQDDTKREKLKTIGYVAHFILNNGFSKSLYMNVQELKKHGQRFSKSYSSNSSLWLNDFDSMARKTVIKLLLSKYAPLNTEMQKAQEADQAIITEDGYEYLDNKKQSPEQIAREKEKARIMEYIKNSKTLDELQECVDSVNSFKDKELDHAYSLKVDELEILGRQENEHIS